MLVLSTSVFGSEYSESIYKDVLSYIEKSSNFRGDLILTNEINENNLPRLCLGIANIRDQGSKITFESDVQGLEYKDQELMDLSKKLETNLRTVENICLQPQYGKKATKDLKKLIDDIHAQIKAIGLYNSSLHKNKSTKITSKENCETPDSISNLGRNIKKVDDKFEKNTKTPASAIEK